MTEERRKFVRLSSQLHATWRIIGSAEAFRSLTRNVGGGGIGFFTETRLAPGTLLQIEVKFPNSQRPVSFTAEVIWSGPLVLEGKNTTPRAFETGVRFLEISSEDRAFVMQYAEKVPGTS